MFALTGTRVMILAITLTLLAYWPVSDAGFVYEDEVYVTPAQTALSAELLLAPRGLTWLTFRWNAVMAGLNARPYHATNLLLHLLVGLSLFALAQRVLTPKVAALAASLYFVHPLNSEAVAYLAQRAELLAALGTLWVVWALSAPVVTWQHLTVVVIGCVVAVGGKDLGVMALPLAALWVAWFRPWQDPWSRAKLVGVGLLVGGIGLLLTTIVLQVRVINNAALGVMERTWFPYLALQATSLWAYLRILLLPFGQTVDHDPELYARGWHLLSVLGLVGLAAGAWWGRRRWPIVTGGVWWMLVAISPRFVVRITEYLRESQVLVAFLGLWIALAAAMSALTQWAQSRLKDDACDASSSDASASSSSAL